jgi:WS/DGAT/MGAT family acyltransferase
MTDFARAIEVALPATARRAPEMPWNKALSGNRRTAWMDMNFQEVRGIRSKLGGTVNDVVLTVLGGALGRYLQSRGVRTDGMKVRVMIPVNVREENQQGMLGNRVSMMLPDIPVGIANPAERLVAVREEMERLKSEEQAGAFEAMRRQGDNIPAFFHALAGMMGIPSGVFNLVCTNVPGPLIPLYAVGHRLLEHIPLVPLADSLGLGVGVTSYDKSLYMGVMSDPNIVPEVDEIAAHADEEFRVLRYIADVPVTNLPSFGVAPAAAGANGAEAASAAAAATVDAPIEDTTAAPVNA